MKSVVATSGQDLDHATMPGTAYLSPLSQVLRIAQYQLTEFARSRRLLVLVGVAVAIGVILTVVVARFHSTFEVGPSSFYSTLWGGGAGPVIALAAVLLGGDAIAGEFQNRTGYFLMGLPLRRASVYLGKYLAALLASLLVLALFFTILVADASYLFGSSALTWTLALSFALATTYLSAVLATAFLLSSLFKNGVYSFVLTALLFLVGFSLVQDFMQGLAQLQPWELISYASQTIGEVFQPSVHWGLTGTGVQAPSVGGNGGVNLHTGNVVDWTPGIAEGAVIMAAYWALTLLAGLSLFEREEFA